MLPDQKVYLSDKPEIQTGENHIAAIATVTMMETEIISTIRNFFWTHRKSTQYEYIFKRLNLFKL